MGVLDEIVARTRSDLAERRIAVPVGTLEDRLDAVAPPRPLLPRLREGFGAICEVKRSSPSKGALAPIPDPAALAGEYAAGGAAAISVLTEPHRFGGSLDDLVAVRRAVDVPVLRKDFLVDPYQIIEARAAGADIVLLIVAALSDADLRALYALARSLDLTVLVEAHTAAEVDTAVELGARLVGVNNRDLQTLQVDLAQFETLAGRVPAGIVKVAESGIFTAADVARLVSAGADAILVGEALVRHGSPAQQVATFTAAGRAATTTPTA
ncbi:indole-3-glycerol phosphate synthase TrpC [Propionicicella superfundia]|uniref:indole-3-glycerol phosphate synthase TrpC n=1 Tax=Propionicicella superfundia TaxID=348582 RepID=UPI0003FB9BC7|nr:indole-3-glycerol phosphate synthase TrpC [Propionicicella superfundia]